MEIIHQETHATVERIKTLSSTKLRAVTVAEFYRVDFCREQDAETGTWPAMQRPARWSMCKLSYKGHSMAVIFIGSNRNLLSMVKNTKSTLK